MAVRQTCLVGPISQLPADALDSIFDTCETCDYEAIGARVIHELESKHLISPDRMVRTTPSISERWQTFMHLWGKIGDVVSSLIQAGFIAILPNSHPEKLKRLRPLWGSFHRERYGVVGPPFPQTKVDRIDFDAEDEKNEEFEDAEAEWLTAQLAKVSEGLDPGHPDYEPPPDTPHFSRSLIDELLKQFRWAAISVGKAVAVGEIEPVLRWCCRKKQGRRVKQASLAEEARRLKNSGLSWMQAAQRLCPCGDAQHNKGCADRLRLAVKYHESKRSANQ